MLIKCPECDLQVSTMALNCPHCGYPIDKKAKYKRSSKKRMRLPNGFGQITEIKNQNLRKRFRAMVTVGVNDEGKYITKTLKPNAYFKTYNEAYEALVEYHKAPYNLDNSIIVEELFDKWMKEYSKTLKSDSSVRTIYAAWKYCSSVYKLRVEDIRARHIKYCMEEGTTNIKGELKTPSPGMKARIKSIFNLMLDYALEYELVKINYARTFNVSSDTINEQEKARRGHFSFTEKELNKLWENINVPYVDVILIQCYMGWRPQELCELKLENINLEGMYIIGGMKTKAGIDRKVPIHEKIKDLVKDKYKYARKIGSEYLINCTDSKEYKMTYDKYRNRFNKVIEVLEINKEHRAHDCRDTFVTLCKKYNVDEYAIKYLVGHSVDDITEKIYTTRSFEWLVSEISKIM